MRSLVLAPHPLVENYGEGTRPSLTICTEYKGGGRCGAGGATIFPSTGLGLHTRRPADEDNTGPR